MNHSITHCINCGCSRFQSLFQKNNFNILKCRTCQLVFTDIPRDYELKTIYKKGYFNGTGPHGYANYERSERILRKKFKKHVSVIRKLSNFQNNLKLLEVGCAYGYFLDEASQYYQSCGIEISAEAAAFARKRGHTVHLGEVNEKILNQIGSLDIIVMLDVIEHVSNPYQLISQISRFLNPGGLILITTGDIDSVLAQIMKKHWRLITPPQHTYFFSKHTLFNLLCALEFSIIKMDRPWQPVPLALIMHQLGTWFGFTFPFLNHLSHVAFHINLFDTMRIVARKNMPFRMNH